MTRQEKIKALISRDIQLMKSSSMREILEYGIKGYHDYTDEEIDKDYELYIK